MVNEVKSAPPTIPDHELLQPIGRGSYGEVWLARNILGTLRAVKIVRRDSFSSTRPFEREFAGIQRVEPLSRGHEGLVDILHVGRGESDSFFYYVMELGDAAPGTEIIQKSGGMKSYVPRSLASDLTSRGRLSVSECIELFHTVALALAHLHRAGLVHRDLKPSNIIFVGGIPKLADIGLVATAGDVGSYVGTEGFIPPEGAGTVGADIYSFGKVLYEAGTGKDRSDFPALPSDAANLDASTGLLELNAIWLKASATAPADRYQTVEDLAADLALLRAGRSVKRLRVVEGRLKRARRLSMVAAVLAIIIAIGWIVTKHQAEKERASRIEADGLRQRAVQAEHEARNLLSEARLAQARAILKNGQIGRRAVALALLTNQVSPHDRVEARSLAAAALALPDLVSLDAANSVSSSNQAEVLPQPDGSFIVPTPDGKTRTLSSEGPRRGQPFELSKDRRFFWAAYRGDVVRLWDLTSGNQIALLRSNFTDVAFRPHHDEATASYINGDIISYHLPDWRVEHRWTNLAGNLFRWDDDGNRLVMVKTDHHVCLLNGVTGEIKELGNINLPVLSIAWHPDGRHLVITAADGYVRVQDIEAWPEYALLTRHEAQIVDATFLPPFPWLITSSWDGTSKLWDWQAGQELGRLEATGYDLQYDAREHILHWRLGMDSNPQAWRVTGGEVWRQFFHGNPRETGGPFTVAFSGDSQWVVTPDNEGLRIWHIEYGDEALFLPVYAQSAWLNADGTELWANGNDAIRHWHLTLEENHRLKATELENLGFAHYEGKLAVSADASVIGWIDSADLKLMYHGAQRSWKHGQIAAEAVAISPNGKFIAVGTRNQVGARVFNTADGRLLWETKIGNGTHLNFSADSQWLAIGTEHGCYVFTSDSGKLRWSKIPSTQEEPSFWEVAFSPDGNFLAWTPKPSQVQILNANDGSEVLNLDYPSRRYITRLAFSPDGRWLAETSNEHTLHLWDMRELHRQLAEMDLGW